MDNSSSSASEDVGCTRWQLISTLVRVLLQRHSDSIRIFTTSGEPLCASSGNDPSALSSALQELQVGTNERTVDLYRSLRVAQVWNGLASVCAQGNPCSKPHVALAHAHNSCRWPLVEHVPQQPLIRLAEWAHRQRKGNQTQQHSHPRLCRTSLPLWALHRALTRYALFMLLSLPRVRCHGYAAYVLLSGVAASAQKSQIV